MWILICGIGVTLIVLIYLIFLIARAIIYWKKADRQERKMRVFLICIILIVFLISLSLTKDSFHVYSECQKLSPDPLMMDNITQLYCGDGICSGGHIGENELTCELDCACRPKTRLN